MASIKLYSSSTSQTQAQCGSPVLYRRSGTCKAPRKRLALLTLQKRSVLSVNAASTAVTAYGGDGPKGPADNYRSWGSGDGDFGYGHGNGYMHLTPVALGVVLAGMMVATWQAGPPAATAATIADMAVTGVTEDYFEADRSLVQFPSFSAVIEDTDEYLCCGEGFTADEKELVVPKQYRVREWVFVH